VKLFYQGEAVFFIGGEAYQKEIIFDPADV
jgi:hypothetical protein